MKDGLFKTICNVAKPKTIERKTTYTFDANKIKFFKMSLGDVNDSSEGNIFNYYIENSVIAIGYGYKLLVNKQTGRKNFLLEPDLVIRPKFGEHLIISVGRRNSENEHIISDFFLD